MIKNSVEQLHVQFLLLEIIYYVQMLVIVEQY